MLCQDCNKREAHVQITQIVNNDKTMLSLCKDCAAARGFHSPLENAPFPLAEILSGLAQSIPKAGAQLPVSTVSCPNCGLAFDEFARQGRFGCGECYKTFRGDLEKIMRKIHGASLHRGKAPIVEAPVTDSGDDNDPAIPVKEEERLEAELKKAVEAEDFERAAEIRDKLKTMRDSFSVES
ncbi:MAG: UvrB/UvrC motif-containing protein [candidate division Zixibacteria bacterium]|nr:UvrB/UvrC motif-containing protein [candidate division Zixibacteria bacterium]MDH3938687.1 UvrB/UvrC motif-containing protein [candidate division Zixibacteria bacterium]MDH4034159.1 UvrB/UvrC motif-containing protein [candidate division Zixibacteria bacterium]